MMTDQAIGIPGMTLPIENQYLRLPEPFYAPVAPAKVPPPRLLAWNGPLAASLGLADFAPDDDDKARVFSGNLLPDGANSIALAYAGHQFGHFVPQLGDGRAVLIGDLLNDRGQRVDLQLKGAGRTPFSRGGDGKSSLGPVIREYILSEAMHHLGVPTTRALAAVATGELVYRESALPGGILTRVASSHLRIGTFEYFAARGATDELAQLVSFAIHRHYPEVAAADDPVVAFFGEVVSAQATLIANWMSLGFIHGVMNTDNMTISGETLDYGPCAFMDEFVSNKVFSSIDRFGRYAFDQQPVIAHWNLASLAACLQLVSDDRQALDAQLKTFDQQFNETYVARMRLKLGLLTAREEDVEMIASWMNYLQDNSLDFTVSFRALANQLAPGADIRFGDFERAWRERVALEGADPIAVQRQMQRVNPYIIPRNHLVEQTIDDALNGDFEKFKTFNRAILEPYVERAEYAPFAVPPTADQRVRETFCGT